MTNAQAQRTDSAPAVADPQLRTRYERIAREDDISLDEVMGVIGHVSKDELLGSLSRFHRAEAAAYSDAVPAPARLLSCFTPEYLLFRNVVPIGEDGDRVIVVMENPQDVVTRDDVSLRLGGRNLLVRVGIREDIQAFIFRFYRLRKSDAPERTHDASLDVALQELEFSQTDSTTAMEEEAHQDEVGVVRLVNELIELANAKGASDIHLEPYPDSDLVVRFRIDGVCRKATVIPRRFSRAITSRIKIMSGLDIAERRMPQDGKIRFAPPGHDPIELRVAVMPTQGGLEDVVLRILSSSKAVPLDRIGMSPDMRVRFEEVTRAPYGLILCVGPTGSGKTTTLHSALAALNSVDRKIWTAEDPVEITQRGIRQVQVYSKIGLSFERALRGFLRCDPDVIMIGEMRDRETADAAIEASLTGHLVFSTLHTNNAPETVTRLLDMGLDPFSFGDSLLAVLAQRLVRSLCPQCAAVVPLAPEMRDAMEREYGGSELWTVSGSGDTIREARGCPECDHTGEKGRMGIHELLVADATIRPLIYSRAPASEIRAAGMRTGMRTLKQDGLLKVLQGRTSLREVRRVAGL